MKNFFREFNWGLFLGLVFCVIFWVAVIEFIKAIFN